jgi:hypothetical protein
MDAEFLDEIQTNALRVFLLAVQEKGGNLRENHTLFPLPYRNLKSENAQYHRVIRVLSFSL